MEREIKSRKDYKEKYGTFIEFNQVLAIYGALGMLLRRKLIDLDLINDVTVNTVTILYEKVKPLWEPFLKERRIEWDSFQYLYNEMKKREQVGVKIG